MLIEKLFIIFVLLVPVFIVAFSFWRQTYWFVLYWTIIVGAVRKWLLPGYQEIIFFSIHMLLVGVYARFFLLKRRNYSRSSRMLNFMILSLVVWGLISLTNPQMPHWAVGTIGFMIHFYFIPIAYLAPYVIRHPDDLMKGLRNYALFALPILILGMIQYFLPPSHILNRYSSETLDMRIALVGQYTRVTGTFSYISGYTAYLNALIMILMFLIPSVKTKRARVFMLLLFLMTFLNLMMTGSRGPFFISLLSVVLYALISLKLGLRFIFKMLSYFVLTVMIAGAVISQSKAIRSSAREVVNSFWLRTTQNEDIGTRLVDTFTPFKFLGQAGILGNGIGTTYQGVQQFIPETAAMVKDYEEEPERIVLEMGAVGYFLTYGLRLYILVCFVRLFFKLNKRDHKLLALIVFLFQLQFLQLSPLVFNLTTSVFYWFFTGMLFVLPKLERQAIVEKQL